MLSLPAAPPSRCTVHAPHWATPHPYFVPVSVSSSRRTHSSGTSLSTSRLWFAPLIRNATIDTSGALVGGHPRELTLHRVDLPEIALHVVIATFLGGSQSKSPTRVRVARPGAAQVDDRCQILLLLERGGAHSLPRDRARDASVQERRRQL